MFMMTKPIISQEKDGFSLPREPTNRVGKDKSMNGIIVGFDQNHHIYMVIFSVKTTAFYRRFCLLALKPGY